MRQSFAAVVLGGTGQVGGAAVTALLAIPQCREVVMLTRKAIPARPRVRNVVVDTAASGFAADTAAVVREVLAQGPAAAVSCVGIDAGTLRMREDDFRRTELGVVGAFARGCRDGGIVQFCLLSAVGSSPRSPFKYVRVMGLKEDTVRAVGFPRLAIFRPGIIVGNVHTPAWSAWLGRLLPGPYGNIDQSTIGRAIAAEIALHMGETGEVILDNATMTRRAAELSTA